MLPTHFQSVLLPICWLLLTNQSLTLIWSKEKGIEFLLSLESGVIWTKKEALYLTFTLFHLVLEKGSILRFRPNKWLNFTQTIAIYPSSPCYS